MRLITKRIPSTAKTAIKTVAAISAAPAPSKSDWFSTASAISLSGGDGGGGSASGGGEFDGRGCSCGGDDGGVLGSSGGGSVHGGVLCGSGEGGKGGAGCEGGEGGKGGEGGEGGASGGGVVGGALVSDTVRVGAVTTRPVRLVTAAARVFEIVLALTLPAWSLTALLWFCRVA